MQLDPDHHDEFIRWALGLFKLVPVPSEFQRPVYITPYDGRYGLAGYVFVINGTPPSATVVVQPASRTLVAFRGPHVVRGSGDSYRSKAENRRYNEGREWLDRLNLEFAGASGR